MQLLIFLILMALIQFVCVNAVPGSRGAPGRRYFQPHTHKHTHLYAGTPSSSRSSSSGRGASRPHDLRGRKLGSMAITDENLQKLPAHHHPVDAKYLSPRYAKTYPDGTFRNIELHGREFFVRTDAKDIIEWVTLELEGEGKVTQSFEKTLRIGDDYKSDWDGTERGYCTDAHRTHNGGKHAIFLDIGSNAGIYGLYAAALGCRVYFFEVQETCHDWVNSAIDFNKFHHAALVPYPVNNVTGTLHFTEKSNGCHGSFSFSKTGTDFNNEAATSTWLKKEPFDVQMVRIDELLDNAMTSNTLAPIAAIKIDVEGFELGVLASMHRLVRHKQPDGSFTVKSVVVELAPARWSGLPGRSYTPAEGAEIICQVLWDAGFHVVTAFGNNLWMENRHKTQPGWDDHPFSLRKGVKDYITEANFHGFQSEDFEFRRSQKYDRFDAKVKKEQ